MNRNDFPLLKQDIIYFDNGATTLKPNVLKEGLIDYYDNFSSNIHRGDYKISLKADYEYDETRRKVKEFINAKSKDEIIFTSGATDSLNKIISGYFKNTLKKDDEVLITLSEHASNVLPWFELQDEIGIKVKYIELDNLEVKLENIKKAVTPKTKVISLAHVTNVIGDIRPIEEITKYAHENGIQVLVDGAQSIAHMKIDVTKLDVDFFIFSAHKMYGPTGVGVIYGKEELLKNMKPIIFGGGMNSSFNQDGTRIYHDIPTVFEAGTPNVAGVIAFGRVIDYLSDITMEKIEEYEKQLKTYAVEKIKEIKNIKIYNEHTASPILAINMENVFAQDLAIYLDKYNICVRAGNHCAKILKDEIGVKNTVRISFGLYNTKEEIDKLVEALKNENIKQEIIA